MGLERFTAEGGAGGGSVPGPVARALGERRARPTEVCDLCSTPVGGDHRHVVDVVERSLRCTCRACALLFTEDGAAGGQHKTVPERHRELERFELERRQWAALRIPVDLAFVMRDSHQGRIVAFYPSPAGATGSDLPLEAWEEIVAANPSLEQLEADVEAVLIRVRDDHAPEAYTVPIDRCYELVGHLRLNWRGFGGGQEVRRRIDAFFEEVRAEARSTVGEATG